MDQRVKSEKLIGYRIELLVMVKDVKKLMKKDLLAACFEQVKVN